MNLLTIIFLNDSGMEFVPRIIEPSWHESEFNVIRATTSDEVIDILAETDVSVILSSDPTQDVSRAKWYKLYQVLPNYIKGKWINIPNVDQYDSQKIAEEILDFYGKMVSSPPSEFFSIVTPIYHTKPHVFERLYNSIKKQTYIDWEWVIVDDSKNKEKTRYVETIASKDFRIKYYNLPHSGNIGQVKKRGFMLSEGTWIMEVDHDDIILPKALENTRKAFEDPEVGFVYSDCVEANIDRFGNIVGTRNYATDENGNATDGWWGNSGTGKHYWFNYKGQNVLATRSPNQNSQTVRHITTMPNHLRCWRADIYKKLGGHSPLVHVADDFELMIRTFLITKFGHLNSVEYIQFYETESENTNTQYSRNQEIQRMVAWIGKHYDEKIHDRFKELGVEDYCWNGQYGEWWGDFGDAGKKFYTNLEL